MLLTGGNKCEVHAINGHNLGSISQDASEVFLSTNLKNGPLLTYKVRDWLHRRHDINLQRISLVAYGGSLWFPAPEVWWLIIPLWNQLTNLRKFMNDFHYLQRYSALMKGLWALWNTPPDRYHYNSCEYMDIRVCLVWDG